MADQLVKKETFDLAKIKGFDVKSCRCGGFPECICNFDTQLPTQETVHKWLRDEYALFVKMTPHKTEEDTLMWFSQVFSLRSYNMTFKAFNYLTMFGSGNEYENAFEKGLVMALNLLKDKEDGSNEL